MSHVQHVKWYLKYFPSSVPSYFQLISSKTMNGDLRSVLENLVRMHLE